MAQFGRVRAHQAEFHGTSALATVGVLLGVAFGLSTLITPLYVIYQQSLGSSQITLTLIHAAYATGNVAALLLFGHVSDRVGRRAAALSAIVVVATQTLESRIRGSLQVVNQIAPADKRAAWLQLFRLLFHRQRAPGHRRRCSVEFHQHDSRRHRIFMHDRRVRHCRAHLRVGLLAIMPTFG
jgi:hypothetical protein